MVCDCTETQPVQQNESCCVVRSTQDVDTVAAQDIDTAAAITTGTLQGLWVLPMDPRYPKQEAMTR